MGGVGVLSASVFEAPARTQRIERCDAWRSYRLTLASQHGQNHVAAGDAGFQRFNAGGLDCAQPMIEHGAPHFDELAIAVGVAFQLGADLGQGRRQIPIFEGSRRCAMRRASSSGPADRAMDHR